MLVFFAALTATWQSIEVTRTTVAPSFRLVQELRVPTLAPTDEFGSAVALDEGRLAVGAFRRLAPAPLSAQGAVFVFERGNQGEWNLVQEISPPMNGSAFGRDVAISGDTLAIGFDERSAVALYERNGPPSAPYVYTRLLMHPSNAASFGYSVELDGDILVAGGPGLETYYCNAHGLSAIFDRNAGGSEAWGVVYSYYSPLGCDGNGWSVALDGLQAFVGEAADSPFASTCYYACAHTPTIGVRSITKEGEPWVEGPRLTTSSGFSFNGRALALERDLLAISRDGGAAILNRVEGAWLPEEKVSNGEIAAYSHARVALDGERLFMSARHHPNSRSYGRVFVHDRDLGGPRTWGRRMELTSPRRSAADRFGVAIAAENGLCLVGASGDDVAGMDSGAAFLFAEATPTPPPSESDS